MAFGAPMVCRVSRAEEAKMQEQVAPGSQDLPSYGVGAKPGSSESSSTATCPELRGETPLNGVSRGLSNVLMPPSTGCLWDDKWGGYAGVETEVEQK